MKKVLAIFLLLAMLLACFVGCAKNDENDDTTTAATVEGEKIPLPEADYSGKDFTILARQNYSYEWDYIPEEAGAAINDAIYQRNEAVQRRYGVKLTMAYVSNADFEADFMNPLNNSIKAGDDSYQLAAGYEYRLAPNVTTGAFLNWYDVPYVDLDGEWWDKEFAEAVSYKDNAYIMTGSLSLSHLYSSSCFFFNQDMLDSIKSAGTSEALFASVKDGSWTIEKFYELAADCSSESGDGEWDITDTYGFATNTSTAIDGFLFAFDIPVSVRNNKGEIVLNPIGDKTVDALKKINDFVNKESQTFIQPTNGTEIDPFVGMLKEKKAVFSTGRLADGQTLRTTDVNYGIIPYPKWEASQENYYSFTLNYSTAFAIPTTVKDQEFVGTITEALAYFSHKYVRDALYNTVLKYRDAKDLASSECIDIILSHTKYDFAYIYAYAWGDVAGPATLFRKYVDMNQNSINVGFIKSEKSWNTTLEKFLQNFNT